MVNKLCVCVWIGGGRALMLMLMVIMCVILPSEAIPDGPVIPFSG